MKILYSQIKELIPDLSANAKEVGEVLTMTGIMMDSFEEVEYNSKSDYLIGLEVRQNRSDCLSIIGVAREIAAYYGFNVKLPDVDKIEELPKNLDVLDINVKDKKEVKRILAIQINNLKNEESPSWLKEFLIFYDINPINLLVDLSNYVMIYTGYASHLLDVDRISNGLEWLVNKKKETVKTLDDTKLELNNNELVIRDDSNILALAGIVGCKTASININTTSIIAEMAVYNRSLIMQNSRALSIVTEASNRLSKDLDIESLSYSFDLLINLILKYGKGDIVSNVYSYYPEKRIIEQIVFDPYLPSKVAGLEISKEKVIEVLENLRFKIEDYNDLLKVTPPSDRTDISLSEDLAEEVIRMIRFDTIPSEEIPKQEVTKDITPPVYYFKDKVKDFLVALGYDEILSQPLVGVDINKQTNWQEWDSVTTQNSVNEEYPDLRQSIASGLLNQLDVYLKKNLNYIHIFEVGKIFGKKGKEYIEQDSLGMLWHLDSDQLKVNDFKFVLEKLLRHLGLSNITYKQANKKPGISNPYACWTIMVNEQSVGILYKLKPLQPNNTTYFCEMNLDTLLQLSLNKNNSSTVEITQRLVALDANLELASKYQLLDYFQKIRDKIGNDKLWSIEVVDEYKLSNEKNRYTVRVTYQELSDQEAKEIHLKIFNLK